MTMSTERLGMDDHLGPKNDIMVNPLGADSILSDDNLMLSSPGMEYSLNTGHYPGSYGNAPPLFNSADKAFQGRFPESYDQPRFADAMSAFTYLQPPAQEDHSPATTVNPTNMWQPQHNASSADNSSRPSQISSPSVKIEDIGDLKPTPESASSTAEGESPLRARHAANERHNKSRKARRDSQQSDGTGSVDDKKVRLRAKNKVAAAKCRQRQRKQAQSIQEKGGRLSEANAQLKASVQELRGELNGLRAMALSHQGCNCQVAKYNYGQAERLAAEYNSTYVGHGSPACDFHMTGPPS